MRHDRLVKEIEKLGLKVELSHWNNRNYYALGEVYICSWYKQDDDAICVNLRRHNDHHDSQSDYYAGFNPSTIKTIKEYLSRVKQCEIEQNASYAMTS